MKFLQLSVFSFFVVIFCLGLFTGCSKEGDTVVQGDTIINVYTKTNFVLNVHSDPYGEKGTLDVYFSTNDMSVVPEVKVNNVKITDLDLGYSLQLSGTVDSTKNITFSITANGKTTSGQFTLPKAPEIISVNDSVPDEDYYVYLNQAPKYTIKWTNSGASQYFLQSYNYDTDGSARLYTTATSTDLTFRYGSAYLSAINGFDFNTGTGPNVKGDYGDGYVTVSSESSKSSVYLREAENMGGFFKAPALKSGSVHKSAVYNEMVKLLNSK